MNSFPSLVNSLLYTDKIVSTEWLNPAPRRHICDCFGIYHPRWTLLSAVIKSPICSARGTASPVRFLQGAFVILVRLRISELRSFGK